MVPDTRPATISGTTNVTYSSSDVTSGTNGISVYSNVTCATSVCGCIECHLTAARARATTVRKRRPQQPALVDPWMPRELIAAPAMPVWPAAMRRFRGNT